MHATPLWIDADPSAFYWTGLDCDDDLAILAAVALHRRRAIDLRGLSICGGNAPLAHTWHDARVLWEYIDGRGLTGVSPIKGSGWKSMQVAVGLLRFFNSFLPDDDDSDDAPDALAERLLKEQSSPTNILTLGPPTNLAKALKKMQSSSSPPSGYRNINHIYLMGGEMTNRTLDLNFRSDRGAARAIVEADVPKTIVPIQTCGQTAIAWEHLERFRCDGSTRKGNVPAVCALLPKMRQQIRRMPQFVNRAVKKRMDPGTNSRSDTPIWTPSPNLDRGFIPWDLVALLSITHPAEFTRWEHHRISIPPCRREPCDGNMIIEENLGGSYEKNWSGIVRVPHAVKNETRLVEIMLDLIGEVPAASAGTPRMMWGFAGSLTGFAIASTIFLMAVYRSAMQ